MISYGEEVYPEPGGVRCGWMNVQDGAGLNQDNDLYTCASLSGNYSASFHPYLTKAARLSRILYDLLASVFTMLLWGPQEWSNDGKWSSCLH